MAKKLKPGKMNYQPLKSFSTYAQFAFNSIEPAWIIWGKAHIKEGIAIEKKFDGMRSQIHLNKGKIWIFTEDKKRNIVDNFPHSAKEALREFKDTSLILDSEFVDYDNKGKPRARRDMIEFVVGKQEKVNGTWKITDINGQFNVFDILYLDGEQVWKLPWKERQKFLKQVLPKDLDHFHRVIPIIADTESEFKKAIKTQSKKEGSEGAMLKVVNSPYELDGRTTKWAKYKHVLEVHLQVIKKKKKKRSPLMKPSTKVRTYTYDVGYKDRDGKIRRAATTYSTNVQADVGDILTLVPVKVLRNLDKKTGELWFSLIFPRVKEKSTDRKEPDTFAILDKIAEPGDIEAEGLPRVKKESKASETTLDKKGLKKYCDYILQYPQIPKPQFVMQEHRRSESVHTDLRWQISKDVLVGLTLFTPGNLKQRSKIIKHKKSDKIELACKPYQPSEWLQVEGKITGPKHLGKFRDIEFTIIEKGWLEVGAIKQEGFIELFFHGTKIPSLKNGARWIVRKLKIRGRWTWLMFKPKDQRPYIETHPKSEWPRKLTPKKIRIDRKEVERSEMISSSNLLSQEEETIQLEIDLMDLRSDGLENLDGMPSELEIGLIALSEGVWNGLYWPRNAILEKRSYQRLKNKPVRIEHNLITHIGQVDDSYPFDEKSIFAKIKIFDPDAINDILSGRFQFASVRVIREADRVRGIVQKILDYREISLVEKPACKVCKFTYLKSN